MKYFFLIIILFLSSCSSIRPIHKKIENSEVNNSIAPNISENQKNENVTLETKVKKEETIRIGDKGGEVFDEDQSATHQRLDVTSKKIKVGITFGPGLNRAINYIEVLKELEKNNVKISIINGTEMGAVVAALYAAGNTPEMIEWMFFKYFKDKTKTKIFENDWLAEIDEFFLQKIKGLKVEDLKIKFFTTIYDAKTQKVYYFDKGNLHDLVMLSLRPNSNPVKYANGTIYSGAFEYENYNANILTGLGANFKIAVDALVNNVSLSSKNNLQVSKFLKISTDYQNRKKKYDYILNLPISSMTMDGNEDAEMYIDKTNNYLNSQVINLKKRLQSKQDLQSVN